MHPHQTHLPRRIAVAAALISALALPLGVVPLDSGTAQLPSSGHACPLAGGCPPGPIRSAPISLGSLL